MNVAYIAGPYRADTVHGIVTNICAAEAAAVQLWNSGYAVICPHKNTGLLDGAIPDHVILDGDKELLRRCDLCVMLPGWQRSIGARAEEALAEELGMPILYMPEQA